MASLWSYVKGHSVTNLAEISVEALAHCMRIGTRVSAKKLEALGARRGLPYSLGDKMLQNEFQSLFSCASIYKKRTIKMPRK